MLKDQNFFFYSIKHTQVHPVMRFLLLTMWRKSLPTAVTQVSGFCSNEVLMAWIHGSLFLVLSLILDSAWVTHPKPMNSFFTLCFMKGGFVLIYPELNSPFSLSAWCFSFLWSLQFGRLQMKRRDSGAKESKWLAMFIVWWINKLNFDSKVKS